MTITKTLISLVTLSFLALPASAQLTVTDTLTPGQLVQDVLAGNCVSITNVLFNGAPLDAAAPGTAQFNYTGSTLGLGAGVILSTGDPNNIASTGDDQQSDIQLDSYTDVDLATIAGFEINDAAVLEFDFIPTGDSISFRYVFGSEEYPEFVCSTFNDVFGFFLSGPGISGPYANGAVNIALIPGSTTPVSIDNVNNGPNNIQDDPTCLPANSNYFTVNENGADIVYDGITTVLTARFSVQCNQPYHIKLAIGDAFDQGWDSGVFLEAGSFSSVPFVPTLLPSAAVIGPVMYESCLPFSMDFLRTACDIQTTETVYLTYTGDATMGVDITPAFPDSLVFGSGVEQLTVSFEVPEDADGIEFITITTQTLDCEGLPTTADFDFAINSVAPLAVESISTLIACGDSVTFAPEVTGGYGVYTYAWQGGSTDTLLTLSPTTPSTVTLVVSDFCDLEASATQFVDFLPAPGINMSIFGNDEPREGCDDVVVNIIRPQGIQGELPLMISTAGAASNGPDYTIGSTATIPSDVINVQVQVPVSEDSEDEADEEAVITASYTNACAQTVVASADFTILDVDQLLASVNSIETECSEDTMQISTTVVGGVAPYQYSWNGDEFGPNIWVGLQEDASYVVTVTDDCGTVALATSSVRIDCELDIPNVFTPNNDGLNDRWVINGLGGKRNTLRIFNRWGGLIYDVSNYRNNFAAPNVPDGTYFYEILVDGKPEPYTGHLTILRN